MPLTASLVSIVIYNVSIEKLTTARMFFVISIYNLFSAPLRTTFYSVITLIEARIAIKRVENFLNFDDEDDELFKNTEELQIGELKIINGSFSYN